LPIIEAQIKLNSELESIHLQYNIHLNKVSNGYLRNNRMSKEDVQPWYGYLLIY